MPKDINARLKADANALGITYSAYVRAILRQELGLATETQSAQIEGVWAAHARISKALFETTESANANAFSPGTEYVSKNRQPRVPTPTQTRAKLATRRTATPTFVDSEPPTFVDSGPATVVDSEPPTMTQRFSQQTTRKVTR